LAWGFFYVLNVSSPADCNHSVRIIKEFIMLENILNKIRPLDRDAMTVAQVHQDQLACPLGSLGRLHEFGVRLAGITGNPRPVIHDLALITMAGDHGVAAQEVSRFPQAVTREMVANFARGGAAINVLTRHVGARLIVVDMGVTGPKMKVKINQEKMVRYLDRNIAPGTNDISKGPAMTREQAVNALETGIHIFLEENEKGLDAVGTGDMGIANTTPSAAIGAAIMGIDPDEVVNRGTGIDDIALDNKIWMVMRALEVNQPDLKDPVDVLSKIGGFEIGGIVGVILGACAHRVPVVVDGFISTSAALLASIFHPEVKNYLFAGHRSAVKGHLKMLEMLGLDPILDLRMRLGEGTGAALALSLLVAASRVATQMLTFEEAQVSGPAVS
jgi:nicotinate-nucleotide--dimethylbenzimidazole phosphoribosyltransferase